MHLDYPPLPYSGPLNQQLQAGAVIRAKGHTQPSCDFFAISLQCGPSNVYTDDVALYLSIAFTPPPRVIRNSLISNQWGPEESFGGLPLAPGYPFEIIILLDPGEFRIAINGQHFTEYRHRVPFERINHVSLSGGDGPPGACQFESFSVWYSQQSSYGGLYPPLPHDSPPGMPQAYSMGPPPPGYNAPYPPGGPGYGAPYGENPSGNYVYPPPDYSPTRHKSGGGITSGLGTTIGTSVAGVAGGMAASSIGSKLFGGGYGTRLVTGMIGSAAASHVAGNLLSGSHGHGGYPKKPKKSKAMPIAGIAAGAGAAALGASLLGKVFKHKHKHSWHHHNDWGGRRGSSSSSSSEEE